MVPRFIAPAEFVEPSELTFRAADDRPGPVTASKGKSNVSTTPGNSGMVPRFVTPAEFVEPSELTFRAADDKLDPMTAVVGLIEDFVGKMRSGAQGMVNMVVPTMAAAAAPTAAGVKLKDVDEEES